ncbi:MAG: hypothetical protein LLG45_13185 [Actinomycetia bacterium]|nr:hypothetical protein [Actinomycetes bacterium]
MPEAKQSQLFVPANEIKTKIYPKREQDGLCDLCGGREVAMSIGSRCLEATIETVIERMIDDGRLDGALQRVLQRRATGSDVPQVDHSLVDEVSGEIRDG